jgi:hypothetical protein
MRAARGTTSLVKLGLRMPTIARVASSIPKIMIPPARLLAIPHIRTATSIGRVALLLNSTVAVSPPAMSARKVFSVIMTLTDTGGRLWAPAQAQMFVNYNLDRVERFIRPYCTY